ncbi:hydroxymethylglutaryl-CoA lyase [Candidatus Berkiella aquae]|nr:hydroxymethylglutaryl-CoA lyase [Candidatus Berkiella aquae]
MQTKVNIVEVGPRDGLQNEKAILPTATKIEFIQRLLASGLRIIEATSFVSPKWIPQMTDHMEVAKLLPQDPFAQFPVLVPNEKGLDNAIACGVKEIAVFAAASETFSKKNINRTISESLADYGPLIERAIKAGLNVRGYVSCTLGCPYEGKVPVKQVAYVAQALSAAGCYQISLGDTIGVGTPKAALEMVKAVAIDIPIQELAVHFHDTYGQALANIVPCLEFGIRTIDSSVAGLGGCPYAVGATGNVATEEVIYLLHGMGFETGVDLDKLIDAGEFICQQLQQVNRSKVATAIIANRK